MHDRTCAHCGTPFVAKKWNGKYCTPLCHSRAHERRRPPRGPNHRGRITKPCEWCGSEFTSKRSNHTRCCSAPCMKALRQVGKASPIPWADCAWCCRQFIKRSGRKYCSTVCLAANHPYSRKVSPIEYGICQRCGALFIRRGGQRGACCSTACAKRMRNSHRKHIHRSANRSGEIVTVQYLGGRDRWTCQLCGKKVNRKAAVPHPAAPTIDHVIPLARGGEHTKANTQLAHFLCNSLKCTAAANEQLRLIG